MALSAHSGLFEFELEIKSINPELNIPYWDWTGESDPVGVTSETSNSPMWSNSQIGTLSWIDNFLGSYAATLGIGRSLSSATGLPSSSQVSSVLALSSFTSFREDLEFSGPNLHGRPHVWVGDGTSGSMSDILRSPTDPIFYFHHAMVDKVWQDWTELGNTSTFSDSDMPTFDGSVSGFSYINPDSIVDSRDIGIFYSDAVNQEVTLSDYSVTNDYLSVEKFIYRYDIIVHDFEVTSGKNVEIISPQNIKIEKNFEAALGATFKMDVN
ncbi:MAG: tyrosinase [Marinoscillum sp.]|jgi:tyrosinase